MKKDKDINKLWKKISKKYEEGDMGFGVKELLLDSAEHKMDSWVNATKIETLKKLLIEKKIITKKELDKTFDIIFKDLVKKLK